MTASIIHKKNKSKLAIVKIQFFKIRKRAKRWGGLVLLFVISFIVTQLLLFYFSNPVLKILIPKLIENQSSDLYTARFDKVYIDLTKRSFAFKNLWIKPDTVVYKFMKEQQKAKTGLYDIKIPYIEFSGINSYQLFFKQKVKINQIRIFEPQVKLLGLPYSSQSSVKKRYDVVNKDLVPFITKYFKSFEVKLIELKNANFNLFASDNFSKKTSFADKLSIKLIGFKIDPNKPKWLSNRVLYSDNVDIKLLDYILFLNDTIHVLKSKELFFSSKNSKIKAVGISLEPLQIDSAKRRNIDKNCYEIHIPELVIDNLDFAKAYNNKEVDISNLELISPTIKLVAHPKEKKDNDTLNNYTEINLYPLIKGMLKSIRLGKFSINNSTFKWYYNFNDKEPIYSTSDFSVVLDEFKLDSAAYFNDYQIFYSKNIDLFMKNFSMKMADRIHNLKIKNISISTKKSIINAEEIEINSNRAIPEEQLKLRESIVFDVYVPVVNLKDINMYMAYNLRQLPIGRLFLDKPLIDIKSYADLNNNQKRKTNNSQIYRLISEYLKIIKIDNFIINKGIFSISNYRDSLKTLFSSGILSFDLINFQLDPSSLQGQKKLFYAEDLKLKLEDYSLKLADNFHILKINELDISTLQNEINIDKFSLQPITENQSELTEIYQRTHYFDLFVNNLKINGANVHDAYLKNQLFINDILIQDPRFRLIKFKANTNNITDNEISDKKIVLAKKNILKEAIGDTIAAKELYELISNYFKKISINKLNLNNGNLSFINNDEKGHNRFVSNNKIDIKLNKFFFDFESLQFTNKFLFSDNIELRLSKQKINLPNLDYLLSIGEIIFSTSKAEVKAKDIQLIPGSELLTNKKKKNALDLNIPEIIMTGVDFKKFYDDRRFILDSFLIISPKITVTNDAENNNFKERDIAFSLPKGIKSIDAKHFISRDGKFYFDRQQNDSSKRAITSTFHLKIGSLKMDSSLVSFIKLYPIDFDSLTLKFDDFTFRLRDDIHLITLKEVNIGQNKSIVNLKNTSVKTIHLDPNLQLQILKDKGRSNLFNISLPDISIHDFDFEKYLETRKFWAKSMVVSDPEIGISDFTQLKSKRNLNEAQKNIYSNLSNSFKDINIKQINFLNGSLKYDKDYEPFFYADKINGSFTNFNLDNSLSQTDSALFFSKNIDLSFSNVNINILGSIYRMNSKNLKFNSQKSNAELKDISIYLDKEKQNKFENDNVITSFADINVGKILLNGIDIPSYVQFGHYKIKKTHFEHLSADILRDRSKAIYSDNIYQSPIEQFKNSKYFIKFDTITCNNSSLKYSEIPISKQSPGVIYVNNINAGFLNLTNDTFYIKNQSIDLNMNLEGNIMGEGAFKTFFKYPLNDNQGKFKWTGNLDSIDLRLFNPYLENTASMSIKEGKLNSLRFAVDADEYIGKGKMRLIYNDLKINLLDKDTTKNTKGLQSLIANSLLRRNNPRTRLSPLRQGQIYYERDPHKHYLHYWAYILITGVKSSLGFNSKEMNEEVRRERKEEKEKRREEKNRNNNIKASLKN